MSYRQTHVITLSAETLAVKASVGTDGRRLTLTSEGTSKEAAIRNMESFLATFKTKLNKEKED